MEDVKYKLDGRGMITSVDVNEIIFNAWVNVSSALEVLNVGGEYIDIIHLKSLLRPVAATTEAHVYRGLCSNHDINLPSSNEENEND